MRSATTAQNTALAGPYYTVGLRVLIADADGNLRDWSNQGGTNWIDSVEIDADVDLPVNGATVTLRRDAGSTLSLAPFRTDSTLNRNNASAYAPAVDAGRLVIVQVATVTAGSTPVTGDFIELFRGYIDRVTWAASAMTLTCRDIGANNADRFVQTKQTYGTSGGVPVQSVMQSILVDWGDGSTLYVPTSPSFNITTYEQQANQSVVDALLALAQAPGWSLRTVWNATAGAFQLALINPNRTKSVADQTIAASRYLAVRDLFIDRTNIRNDIDVTYTDVSTGQTTVSASDGGSQSKYGYRWLGITESSTSPINTGTEAATMVLAIRDDLKDPKAEHEIEMHLDWRIEIGDLLTFQANGVHYDTDQTGAVVTLKHVLTPTQHRTIVRTRGQPAGQYLNWFNRGIGSPITQGPNLAVVPKQAGTNYVIAWSGDDVQLSTDGGSTWATPGTSPITVAMNAPGGVSKVYVFKGFRDGTSIQIPVTIPAQSGSTVPSLSLTPSLASTQVDDTSSSVTLTLGATNLPTAYTWKLYTGYTRGKRTTLQASGSQSSNPLAGNPTVVIAALAKLIQWATLVVTVGSDEYTTDVPINPQLPAFNASGAPRRAQPYDDGNYAPQALDAGGTRLHVSVTDYNSRSVAGMFHKTLDDADDLNDGPNYGRVANSYVDALRRPVVLRRPAGGNDLGADALGAAMGQTPTNLITNGGGQEGATGGEASGWTLNVGNYLNASTISAKIGDRCLTIDHTAGASRSYSSQPIALKGGHTYRLSGWVAYTGIETTSGDGVYVELDAPSGLSLIDYAAPWINSATSFGISLGIRCSDASGGAWQFFQVTLKPSVDQTVALYCAFGNGVGLLNGRAYFDGLELVEQITTLADGAVRGYNALDSNNRLVDQRRMPITSVAGARAQLFLAGTQTPATNALSASGTSITIASLDSYVGDSTPLTYSGQTITGHGSSGGQQNWVYLIDPTYSGAGTFVAVTDPRQLVNSLSRVYIGSITCYLSGSGGSVYCVAPETLIAFASSARHRAADVSVGDVLRTQHEATLMTGDYPVTHASVHEADRWQLTLVDGRTLIAARNHRVYVWGRGWVRLDQLLAGELVMGEPPSMVERVRPLDRGPVVQLVVDDAHTYLSNGILSHNQKPI